MGMFKDGHDTDTRRNGDSSMTGGLDVLTHKEN